MLTPYERFKKHVADWRDCRKCILHNQRSRIVLARGKLPCDILFVGDAPGDSEDVLGLPFIGPSGKLLDDMIARAFPIEPAARIAFTNLVACYSREAKTTGDHQPPREAIKACRDRLAQLCNIAQPKLIIRVGQLATTNFNWGWADGTTVKVADITHPATILRANQVQQSMMIKRVQITLFNAYVETFNA